MVFRVSMIIVLSVASVNSYAEFTVNAIAGKIVRVKGIDYPICEIMAEFTVNGQAIVSGELIGPYIIDEGNIIITEDTGRVVRVEPVSMQNKTYTVKISSAGGTYVDDSYFADNIGLVGNVINNLNLSAENLKNYFITNGLWQGVEVLADGRITNNEAFIDGVWRIENNEFLFDFPESDGCVDHKGFKLVEGAEGEDDKLFFATDAKYQELSTVTILNPFVVPVVIVPLLF